MPWYIRYPERGPPSPPRDLVPYYNPTPPVATQPPPPVIAPYYPTEYPRYDSAPRRSLPRGKESTPPADKKTSNLGRVLLVVGVLAILLLFGAVVWAGIFTSRLLNSSTNKMSPQVMTNTNTGSTNTGTGNTNTDLGTPEKLTVSGSADVTAWQFANSLDEQSSNEYKQKTTDFCNLALQYACRQLLVRENVQTVYCGNKVSMISLIFRSTLLNGGLVSCTVTDLKSGSVVVEFTVEVYKSRTLPDASLRGLVMQTIHCGLVDLYLNPSITVLPNSVFFRDGMTGAILRICGGGCRRQGQYYQCECPSGYTRSNDGASCIDVNECSTDNGGCGFGCMNTEGSFRCSCSSGYTLDTNGRNCTDIDECQILNGRCSHSCVNGVGSYACGCPKGKELASDGRTCFDADECRDMNAGCSQQCVNLDGSFVCQCGTGYTLSNDSTSCLNINECLVNNGGCGGICTDKNGTAVCSCDAGFTLQSDEKTCADIDECSTNNGGCDQLCANSHGSYSCQCTERYFVNPTAPTTCNRAPYVVCRNGSQCDPVHGRCDVSTSSCMCNAGYILADNNRTCVDYNECNDVTSTNCSHGCNNTIGSFVCTCPDGYRLAGDRKTCIDFDECFAGTHSCERFCRGGSIPSPGYTCDCDVFPYYYVAPDLRTCIKFDISFFPPFPATIQQYAQVYTCTVTATNSTGGGVVVSPTMTWTSPNGTVITSTDPNDNIYLEDGGPMWSGSSVYLNLVFAVGLKGSEYEGFYSCDYHYQDPWKNATISQQLYGYFA